MSKLTLLKQVTFGKRVAEEESEELAKYFVETDQWNRIFAGDIDVVYGPKGSGKSAIYSLLQGRKTELEGKAIYVVPAENPKGATAFRGLVSNPPTSETEFCGLWKLYLITLLAGVFRDRRITCANANSVVEAVTQAGLLPRERNLGTIISGAREYVRRLLKLEAIEGGVEIDPATGFIKGVTGRIILAEPTAEQERSHLLSADGLLRRADEALSTAGLKIWLLLDRLDVAFAETKALEENALRALFKVYLDWLPARHIALKVFLRDDIWRRITQSGFREASHITRTVTLSWTPQSLLNLVVRRALRNNSLREFYKVNEAEVLAAHSSQQELFNRIFPAQVDMGEKKPSTFDWMLTRTQDATGNPAPRELIHLLEAGRETQIKQLELGNQEPSEEALVSAEALKGALPEVSKFRLQQTLYAEYPELKPYLEKLELAKTQQSLSNLARVWKIGEEEASKIAGDLVECGFFQKRGPDYWVPFLYREALRMTQGSS